MQTIAPPPVAHSPTWIQRVRRRTVATLVATQILGSIGMIVGMSVSALLVARITGGPGMSGLAQSAVAVGGALLALPVARLTQSYGRRPSLALAYGIGVLGGLLVIAAALVDSTWLVMVGMLLFGGGTTAGLQGRYTAVDLAPPDQRARQISIVIWAGTVGAVAGPMLAAPADRLAGSYGLPPLTGPFFFSMLGFAAAAVLVLVLLRPDPLLTARTLPELNPAEPTASEPRAPAPLEAATGVESETGPRRQATASRPMARALQEVLRRPDALLGLLAVAGGHAVMLGVMVMTPIHIDVMLTGGGSHAAHGGHGSGVQAEVLKMVGYVLSLHVVGMFAFSPLVGHVADRRGRRPVLFAGGLLLVVSCALAGSAGERGWQLSGALFLLGLGWSCTLIAGSTLLSESMPLAVRPAAQGLSDLVMGLAGAAAGALSGVVVGLAGYPMLTAVAALIVVPLLAVAWPRATRSKQVTV